VIGETGPRPAQVRGTGVLFEQIAPDVEDPGRGVVGEDEIVEARSFLDIGAERSVFDLEFAGEDPGGGSHLAVEVVADALGGDTADHRSEQHQDHQRQAGGHRRQAPAQWPAAEVEEPAPRATPLEGDPHA
jgi:hypothetical protein